MSEHNVQKKQGRKIDGFFLTCMAGVAAVSVAATLMISGMTGGEKALAPAATNPIAATVPSAGETVEAFGDLEKENTALRQQVELQKQQIQDLRAQLLDLTGDTAATQPGQTDQQAEAYDIFHQIQAAYDDFDRETLEQLIPEMDKRLEYLSNDALYEYYTILEYVEMPSNG